MLWCFLWQVDNFDQNISLKTLQSINLLRDFFAHDWLLLRCFLLIRPFENIWCHMCGLKAATKSTSTCCNKLCELLQALKSTPNVKYNSKKHCFSTSKGQHAAAWPHPAQWRQVVQSATKRKPWQAFTIYNSKLTTSAGSIVLSGQKASYDYAGLQDCKVSALFFTTGAPDSTKSLRSESLDQHSEIQSLKLINFLKNGTFFRLPKIIVQLIKHANEVFEACPWWVKSGFSSSEL